MTPDNSSVEVIYEDAQILSVNKPAGMAVHEDGHTQGPFLTDWVRETRPDMVGVGETMWLQNGNEIDRPGIVHRLDRDTSGIIVLAKTQESHAFLKAQFQARTMEKEYRAFVWGTIREVHGTIDKPIGRSRKDFRLWSAGKDAGGMLRAAITRYTVLAARDGFSYLSVEPKTGRTHQIRVHLKAVGHPIVCDTRYAPKREQALGFVRLALHAHTLAFTHPDGTRMVLQAPLPDDFLHAEARIGV